MTPAREAGERRRYRRLGVEWWLVALLSTVLVVLLVAGRGGARIDNLIYDGFLRLNGHTPRGDIVIVAIDNRSLAEAGHWPWPRARHADLIERIGAAHPRAIAYDVLFTEPTSADDDARLGEALGKVRSFLPLLIRAPGTNGAAFDAIEPIPDVRRRVTAIGHANLTFDADGLVRRADLTAGDERQRWPHLMRLMQRAAGDQGATRNTVLVGYAGPPGAFPTISAASVLRGEVPPEFLKDKLVLVGATADGLGDQYPTPLAGQSGVMPGIEIHANLLDSLLTGRTIAPVATLPWLLASLLPLWLLLIAFRRLPPRQTALLLFALLIGIAIVTIALLLLFHIWLPPAAALIGLAVVYPLWGWRRLSAVSAYMVAELERFRAEPELLPGTDRTPPGIDLVGRQAALLQGAIGRMEDMRRFALDRLQQMPDPTFVTDPTGTIVLANREAEQLCADTGVDAKGGVGALLTLLRDGDARFPPDDPAGERWEGALAVGRSFDVRIVPQQSRSGERIGWIVRVIDISEARAAERQREDVLRLLSHDMRAPQTSILTALDSAGAGQIASPLDRRIRGHALRTLSLADGFVQLARAEALDYALEEVDLGDVLIETADGLWELASSRSVTVTVDAAEDVVIEGERTLLNRALCNLIDNAIKYSVEGGRVTCRLRRDGDDAICTIEDQGIGIAPAEIDRLFERFHRAPDAIARGIGGAGLGLAFVQTVVTRHGGAIRCDSTPGERTTFTVTLPLRPTEQAQSD